MQKKENLKEELELAFQMASSRTLDEIFEKIYFYLHKTWGFDSVGIQLIDKEENILKRFKSYGINIDDPHIAQLTTKDVSLKKLNSVSGVVALSGNPFYADFTKVEFLERMSPIDKEVVNALNIKENLILPLKFEEQVLGVFHCSTFDKRLGLKTQDIDHINHLINGLSGTIYLAQERLKLEKLKQNQEKLIALTRKMSATLNIEDLAFLLCQEIIALEGESANVLIYHPDKQGLVVEGILLATPYKEMELVNFKNTFALTSDDDMVEAFQKNQIQIFEKKDEKKFPPLLKIKFKLRNLSYLVEIPIALPNEKPIGVIVVYGHEKKLNPFNVKKWQDLSQLFFTALTNASFFTRIKEKEENIEKESKKNTQVLEIADKLNSISSYQELSFLLVQEILNAFDLDIGAFYVEDEKKENLVYQSIAFSDKISLERQSQLLPHFASLSLSLAFAEGAAVYCFLQNTLVYFSDFLALLSLPMHPKDYELSVQIKDCIKSHLIIPVRQKGKPVGVLALSSIKKDNLSQKDISLIESLLGFAGSALANAKIYALSQKQKKALEEKDLAMQEDLKLAEGIQRSILRYSTLPNSIHTFTHYQPQNKVGGDFFQIDNLSTHKIRIFIADATGHGVQAALGTVLIRNEYELLKQNPLLPHEILEKLNLNFLERFPNLSLFFTAFLLDIDIEKKKIFYSSAGHPIQYLMRNQEPFVLDGKGKPVGVIETAHYNTLEKELMPKDRFFLFTDGLIEEINQENEEFGEERCLAFLKQEKDLKSIFENLSKAIQDFNQKPFLEDDFTFIAIEYQP